MFVVYRKLFVDGFIESFLLMNVGWTRHMGLAETFETVEKAEAALYTRTRSTFHQCAIVEVKS